MDNKYEGHHMNQKDNFKWHLRIANFTDMDLKVDHRLDFDSNSIHTIVDKIRQHADLPIAFVISKAHAAKIPEVLSELENIRSTCYPHALFLIDDFDVDLVETDLDIIKINATDLPVIQSHIDKYAGDRFDFDHKKLKQNNTGALPETVDVVIVGAGITGIYAANRLEQAGISYCIVEKREMVGGIWSKFANHTSQVNSSESAYRLVEKKNRSNRDHSYTWEILEDISQLSAEVSDHLFLNTEVEQIEKSGDLYRTAWSRNGRRAVVQSKGVILAVNDRVGAARDIQWKNQSVFQGKIVSGISNDTKGLDWKDKNVVVVGMGAFAIENARTALEGGARHVTVVCRRHGTICPKIIDYLNFATPYDEAFKHDKKSNTLNMMYWKKLYQLSGATQPECWMGKIKHDGHTISVSDIWFVAHYLKKITTITGEITDMAQNSVVVGNQHHIDADIVVNCVGFERNTSVATSLSGYHETYNNNYVDKDFMYLADAYIDADAFNSLFGSSVLEMVKFYMELYVAFFDNPDYQSMMNTEGIEKLPIEDRKWTDYIKGAMSLIQKYPFIKEAANALVSQRTENFLETHDLKTYIAQNKREWIYLHELLSGRPMKEEECLPYVFEKLSR